MGRHQRQIDSNLQRSKLDVYSTFLHPNGKTVYSGDRGGDIREWTIADGKFQRKFQGGEVLLTNNTQGVRYGGVRGLAVSPDNKYLAACGLHKATNPRGAVNEPIALLFDMKTNKKVRSQPGSGIKGIGWQLSWLNDGSLAVASGGSGGGYLLFWRPDRTRSSTGSSCPIRHAIWTCIPTVCNWPRCTMIAMCGSTS
ncbi:MAG: hypothetical protein CM1200mP2_37750 [Planctomycetaceae bacterium]|nr:MAG: hypothetical protein CM1200mP2_37750 [Planctomycetaceae bacterium]